MYNNEVTYAKEWDTDKNNKAYEKLEDKFFDKSYCAPSCPNGWAPEVLELLETIEKELGIERNTSTIRAYYVKGNLFDWFIKDPFNGFFNSIKYVLTLEPEMAKYYPTLKSKLIKIVESTTHPIKYGIKATKVKYINNVLNKIFKPKFRLDQVKEKYGELNIYYTCPEVYEEWVEKQIKMTIIKLAKKGCYYPLESLYNYSSTTYVDNDREDEDIVEVIDYIDYKNQPSKKIKKTTYRSLMKEMGVDMKAVAIKAMILEDSNKKAP